MIPRALTVAAAVIVAMGRGPSTPGPLSQDASAARHPGLTTIAATEPPALEQWDRRVSRMVRAGELALSEIVKDALVPGRSHQRYVQRYKGVPIVGGDVTRQVDKGRTVSVFGTVYEGIAVNPKPTLAPPDAAAAFQKLAGAGLGPSRAPELMILPTDDGRYRLTYRARLATADDVVTTFIDATTGEVVLSVSEMKRPEG